MKVYYFAEYDFGTLIRDAIPFMVSTMETGDIIVDKESRKSLYKDIDIIFNNYVDELTLYKDYNGYLIVRHSTDISDTKYNNKFRFQVEPIQCDYVVCPRKKPWKDVRDDFDWQSLISTLSGTIASVGSLVESKHVEADIYSWDYEDDIIASAGLMLGSKMVYAFDSGMAHLAALLDVPLTIMYVNNGDELKEVKYVDHWPPFKMRYSDMLEWSNKITIRYMNEH